MTQRQILRFTGSSSRDEFDEKCRAQKHWYHSYYFDNGFEIRGDYDIGADVLDYGFPESMAGVRVLDVGTGAGWFAHYFEQLGAEVTTVDARGYCDFDVYGRYYYPLAASEGRDADRRDTEDNPIYDSPVSGGFWIMKDLLGSRVRFVNSRVYDLGPDLFQGQMFDIVFLGAILCHLRDPIGALMAAHRVCRGEVITTTPVVLGEPESEAPPRQYLPYTALSKVGWWLPNEACFRHWLSAAGFRNVNIERSITLRCDVERTDDTGRVVNANQVIRVGRGLI